MKAIQLIAEWVLWTPFLMATTSIVVVDLVPYAWKDVATEWQLLIMAKLITLAFVVIGIFVCTSIEFNLQT